MTKQHLSYTARSHPDVVSCLSAGFPVTHVTLSCRKHTCVQVTLRHINRVGEAKFESKRYVDGDNITRRHLTSPCGISHKYRRNTSTHDYHLTWLWSRRAMCPSKITTRSNKFTNHLFSPPVC